MMNEVKEIKKPLLKKGTLVYDYYYINRSIKLRVIFIFLLHNSKNLLHLSHKNQWQQET